MGSSSKAGGLWTAVMWHMTFIWAANEHFWFHLPLGWPSQWNPTRSGTQRHPPPSARCLCYLRIAISFRGRYRHCACVCCLLSCNSQLTTKFPRRAEQKSAASVTVKVTVKHFSQRQLPDAGRVAETCGKRSTVPLTPLDCRCLWVSTNLERTRQYSTCYWWLMIDMLPAS